MANRENPYESTNAKYDIPDLSSTEIRRPLFGTFLIVFWLLEGGFKTYLLVKALFSGFAPFQSIVRAYQHTTLWWFFLISSFLIIETIGPWIGIYYLTGRRAQTIPFEIAFYRILKAAGISTIAIAFALILYCYVASR